MKLSLVVGVVSVILVFCNVSAQESEAQLEERLVSYQRCRIDSDCRENSFCYDNDNNRIGLCKCQAGYELLIRNITYYACLPLATWGEECQISAQCVDTLGSLARCDGVCGCSEGTYRYPWDGRCHRSVLLGDECRTDANCVLEDGTYAFCTDGHCECNIGLTPSPDKKRCIDAKNLGQNCTDDYQCSLIGNSMCREVCRCGIGYVVSRNASVCLKAATYFFDSCEENDQCSEFLQNSMCNNGNCSCESGYHGYGSRCVRSVAIGQACTATEQCIPSLQYQLTADCVEGVCKCLSGGSDPDGIIGCRNHADKFNLNVVFLVFCLVIYNLL